jgi:serine phosphatase RsbU (regulator of sigma subunit)
MMSDLGDDIERLEELADKRLSIGGYQFTPAQLGMALAGISSIIGALYAGFVMYQKIEEVAGLDLGAYEQKMEVMDAKVQESLDYARDIKNGLRDDILRIEKQTDRVEDMVRNTEEKVRVMIDDAEIRFESKREQLRTSQSADMKELEDRLNAKLQRALDNPLAN